jgi:hypothetical protein
MKSAFGSFSSLQEQKLKDRLNNIGGSNLLEAKNRRSANFKGSIPNDIKPELISIVPIVREKSGLKL